MGHAVNTSKEHDYPPRVFAQRKRIMRIKAMPYKPCNLLDLPEEIILTLPFNPRDKQDRNALLSLARTCRTLYRILIGELYRTIIVDLPTFDESLTSRRLAKSLKQDAALRKFVRNIEIHNLIEQHDLEVLDLPDLALRSVVVHQSSKTYNNLQDSQLAALVRQQSLVHLTLVVDTWDVSLPLTCPLSTRSQSIRHFTLASNAILRSFLSQILTAAPRVKKLSFVEYRRVEAAARPGVHYTCDMCEDQDAEFAHNVTCAISRVKELEIHDPLMSDYITLDGTLVLQQGLRDSWKLKILSILPEVLLPRKANPRQGQEFTHQMGRDFASLLPRSLRCLVLPVRPGGTVPHSTKYMLDVLRAIWHNKSNLPNLESLAVREMPLGPYGAVGTRHVNLNELPRIYRMSFGCVKKMIAGTKHQMGFDLELTVNGIDSTDRTSLKHLRFQDYFMAKKEEEHVGAYEPIPVQ